MAAGPLCLAPMSAPPRAASERASEQARPAGRSSRRVLRWPCGRGRCRAAATGRYRSLPRSAASAPPPPGRPPPPPPSSGSPAARRVGGARLDWGPPPCAPAARNGKEERAARAPATVAERPALEEPRPSESAARRLGPAGLTLPHSQARPPWPRPVCGDGQAGGPALHAKLLAPIRRRLLLPHVACGRWGRASAPFPGWGDRGRSLRMSGRDLRWFCTDRVNKQTNQPQL